jgi:hypothetical protein
VTTPSRAEDLRWLLEPPPPGAGHVHVAVGEGAELTAEVRAALEQLVRALHSQDVQGFGKAGCHPRCDDLANCLGLVCRPLNNCSYLTSTPCAANVDCRISGFQLLR